MNALNESWVYNGFTIMPEVTMTRFIQRFESHSLHKNLENTFNIIFELLDMESIQSEAVIELDRIKQVCLLLKGTLENCDPNLVYMGHLDSIQNHCLNNVLSYLNSYKNDRNLGHLQNANNHFDSYLPTIAGISIPVLPYEGEGIRESIISIRRSTAQHMRHAEEDFKKVLDAKHEIEEGINQVAATVDVQKSRLDTAIADFQQQFSQAEESRRDKFSTAEEERKKAYDQREVDWAEKFKTFSEDATKAYDQFLAGSTQREKDLQDNFSTNATDILSTLEEYKNKAAKTLNIISNTSMAGGYKEVADEEERSRNNWRRITMAAMILLIGASIWSFLHPFGEGSVWAEIAKRVSIAATFATVASYASRQAKVHLDAERVYRRMELELTSLSPYLVELEDAKRQEILAKMAEQFFGKANVEIVPQNAAQTNPEVQNGNLEILNQLGNLASLINPKK
jgi:hypothetical protein